MISETKYSILIFLYIIKYRKAIYVRQILPNKMRGESSAFLQGGSSEIFEIHTESFIRTHGELKKYIFVKADLSLTYIL